MFFFNLVPKKLKSLLAKTEETHLNGLYENLLLSYPASDINLNTAFAQTDFFKFTVNEEMCFALQR